MIRFKCFVSLLCASTIFSLHGVIVINNTSEKITLSKFGSNNCYWGLLEAAIKPLGVPVGEAINVREYCDWAHWMTVKVGDAPECVYNNLYHVKRLIFWQAEDGDIILVQIAALALAETMFSTHEFIVENKIAQGIVLRHMGVNSTDVSSIILEPESILGAQGLVSHIDEITVTVDDEDYEYNHEFSLAEIDTIHCFEGRRGKIKIRAKCRS